MSDSDDRIPLFIIEARAGANGQWFVKRRDGLGIAIPQKFRHFFSQVIEGQSIYQMSLAQPSDEVASRVRYRRRFRELAQFLIYLADTGLLAREKDQRLAESLRPDAVWPKTWIFEELIEFPLVELESGKGSKSFNYLIFPTLLVLNFFIFHSVLDISFDRMKTWAHGLQEMKLWISFAIVFMGTRSFLALFQFLLSYLIRGAPVRLYFGLDLLGFRLRSSELSRAFIEYRGEKWEDGLFLINIFLSYFLIFGSIKFTGLLGLGTVHSWPLLVFSVLLFLLETNPFSFGLLTEWLRSMYAFLDRYQAEVSQKNRESIEDQIDRWHKYIKMSWLIGLGLFVLGMVPGLLVHLRDQFYFLKQDGGRVFSKTGWLSLGPGIAVAVLVGCALLSLLGDAMGWLFDSQRDRNRQLVRRMWKRNTRVSGIESAIRTADQPSQSDLEKLPFIRLLDDEFKRKLLSYSRVVEVAAGTKVCRQGGQERDLYMVLDGQCAVIKNTSEVRRKVVALLDRGSIFGEAAFFFAASRTADVQTIEPCRFLVIRHDPSFKDIEPSRSVELQTRIWFLQALVSSPLFREIPSEALDALLMAGKRKTFKAGEKVISEGDIADACYFLIQGIASVSQNSRLINELKSGDAFGEIAMLTPGALRTASVAAKSDVLLIKLRRDEFLDLLARHLPLALEIEKLAFTRLERDQNRLVQSS